MQHHGVTLSYISESVKCKMLIFCRYIGMGGGVGVQCQNVTLS